MKVKKLLAVLCVLLVLVTIFAMSASAYWGTACPRCGSASQIFPYNEANWRVTNNNTCGHGTNGVDITEQHTGTVICKAPGCDLRFSGTVTRIHCTGTGNYYSNPDEVM